MNCDFLCEKKLASENESLHRIYKDSVVVLQNILTSYQSIFPSYTDHSSLHSMQVANFCNMLVADNIEKMDALEAFVLLMACYFHDTGMGIGKGEFNDYFDSLGLAHTDDYYTIKENIRKFHNDFSAVFVRKHSNFFDFPCEEITNAIAQVSKGHRKVDLFDESEYPTVIHIENYGDVHLPYLASLIRLADEIDIASDRIPEMLVDYDVVAKDEKCVREYEKHHAIRHLKIEEDKFIMQVYTEDEKLFSEIAQLKEKVEKTLSYCRKVIEERTPFTITQKTIELERLNK